MTATATFRFSGFTLRPAGVIATDIVLARQWTEADPDHRGRVKPAFWLEQDLGRDSYLLLDAKGPLFFWKGVVTDSVELQKQVEMHVQFPPEPGDPFEGRRLRGRIREGLTVGLAWLERTLIDAKIREIYFESISPSLILFCTQRLGFKRDGQRLRKVIS